MKHSKFRSTYMLLILFAVLLATVVFYASDGTRRSERLENDGAPVVSTFDTENITQIEMSRSGTESVELIRQDDGNWTVDGVIADQDELTQLLASLEVLTTGEIVSKNPSNWANYNVSEDLAAVIKVYQQEDLSLTLYLGRPGLQAGSVHVRINDDENVSLVETDLSRFLAYDADRWIDTTLMPVTTDDLQAVNVRVGDERWSFAYQGEVWVLVEEEGTENLEEQDLILNYIENLLTVKGTAIERDVSLFEEADNAVAISRNNGPELVVSIDNRGEEGIFAQVSGKEYLLRLSSDLSERLEPSFLEEQAEGEIAEE